MSYRKKGPSILIFLLLALIIFILGVRYGKQVEQTNKAINYVLSLTPTRPPATPSPTPTITFTTFIHKTCGIQFVHPSTFSVKKEATLSAQLSNKTQTINISCEKKNDISTILDDKKIATAEMKFQEEEIISKENKNNIYFTTKHPRKRTDIFIQIPKDIYSLFESTFEFVQ